MYQWQPRALEMAMACDIYNGPHLHEAGPEAEVAF